MPSSASSNVSEEKKIEIYLMGWGIVSEISTYFLMMKNFTAIQGLQTISIFISFDLYFSYLFDFTANEGHQRNNKKFDINKEERWMLCDNVIYGHNFDKNRIVYIRNKCFKSIAVLVTVSILLSLSLIRCQNRFRAQRAGHSHTFSNSKFSLPLKNLTILTIRINFIVKQLLGQWVYGFFRPVCRVRLKPIPW